MEKILKFSTLVVVLLVSIVLLNSRNLKDNPQITIPKLKLNKEVEKREVKIPILMYHYVEYNQNEEDFLRDQQNVPPNVFENQLITLKNAGYTFITPKDIPDILNKTNNDLEELKKYVIISFDDGFRDFYTDAYPILKKHSVSAINYIPYYLIDRQDYMTKDMLEKVAKDPLIEIGSHTLNHAYLLNIPDQIANNEIQLSKDYMEESLGVKVESFAYPFGKYDEKIIEKVKEAGYKTAVTVDSGGIVKSDDLFRLKRVRPGHLGGQYLLNFLDKL